jgi:hypothetical protein
VLRTNLATRPFYNERAVHAGLAILAIAVVAITAYNVTRVVRLSRQNTELSARVSRDDTEAERLRREAAAIRRGIDKDELQVVAVAAREANALIDHRTFSWTAFFNYIESTLPPDVMLIAVRPYVEEGRTHVTMTVVGRRIEDVDEFVEKLEATGAFEDVLPAQADPTDTGLQRAILESVYTGVGAEPEPDAPKDEKPEGKKEGKTDGKAEPQGGKADAPAGARKGTP